MEDTSKQCLTCKGGKQIPDVKAKNKGVVTVLTTKDCPTCYGTGEKKLDSPREKMVEWLYATFNTLSQGDWEQLPKFNEVRQWWLEKADQIIAKMREGGWVSPADLKDALSRELAAGFRLGLNKSKGGF